MNPSGGAIDSPGIRLNGNRIYTDYWGPNASWISVNLSVIPTPEPAAMLLLLVGGFPIAGCYLWRRHFRPASGGRKTLSTSLLAIAVLLGAVSEQPLRGDDWSPLWSTTNLLTASAWIGTAASAGGKVFFTGGFSGTTEVDVYDTATTTWSKLSLSQTRTNVATASAGSKVFFGGGYGTIDGNSVTSDVVDIYDTATTPGRRPISRRRGTGSLPPRRATRFSSPAEKE